MADFGVNERGFTIKGLDVILADSLSRAQQIFKQVGVDVDLTSTSPLRKILETAAHEDAELWKRMEDLYYSNFASTAVGQSLDRLGEDLGVTRQNLFATGHVTLTLANGVPGRVYTLPPGTLLVSGDHRFTLQVAATLSAAAPTAKDVAATGLERGVGVAAAQAFAIAPGQQFLALGQATVAGTNDRQFDGADQLEDDETYRGRLLGLPRNLWTTDSITQAARAVDGVIDVLAYDPLGGVDVSQSYFGLFKFQQRLFSQIRSVGEPYYFDVVVAHDISRPWSSVGGVAGISDQVRAAVESVRPVGIHPNIVEADHITVGLEATILVNPGVDASALLAAVKQRLSIDLGQPRLGGEVRYSQVMRAITEQPGVIDVQNLHLRRLPPRFARFSFGPVPFQADVVEAGAGENLSMGPHEIAIFQIDSELLDFEVLNG